MCAASLRGSKAVLRPGLRRSTRNGEKRCRHGGRPIRRQRAAVAHGESRAPECQGHLQ